MIGNGRFSRECPFTAGLIGATAIFIILLGMAFAATFFKMYFFILVGLAIGSGVIYKIYDEVSKYRRGGK